MISWYYFGLPEPYQKDYERRIIKTAGKTRSVLPAVLVKDK